MALPCVSEIPNGFVRSCEVTACWLWMRLSCERVITEVSIRCQKNPEVGIRRIPAYTPQYTTAVRRQTRRPQGAVCDAARSDQSINQSVIV